MEIARVQTDDRIFIKQHVGFSDYIECNYLDGKVCWNSPNLTQAEMDKHWSSIISLVTL